MSITKTELQNILSETEDNEKLRSRIEELAKNNKVLNKERREFLDMITRLDAALAKAAGKKPGKIDPSVTSYANHHSDGLVYRIGGHYISVVAMLEYQSVSSIEVSKTRWANEIADFRVKPLGPENAVALAVAFINQVNGQKPE